MFNGLLFFPAAPYQGDGDVDLSRFAAHVKQGVDAGGVRPPLTEVTPAHREELARLLTAGLAAVEA